MLLANNKSRLNNLIYSFENDDESKEKTITWIHSLIKTYENADVSSQKEILLVISIQFLPSILWFYLSKNKLAHNAEVILLDIYNCGYNYSMNKIENFKEERDQFIDSLVKVNPQLPMEYFVKSKNSKTDFQKLKYITHGNRDTIIERLMSIYHDCINMICNESALIFFKLVAKIFLSGFSKEIDRDSLSILFDNDSSSISTMARIILKDHSLLKFSQCLFYFYLNGHVDIIPKIIDDFHEYCEYYMSFKSLMVLLSLKNYMDIVENQTITDINSFYIDPKLFRKEYISSVKY